MESTQGKLGWLFPNATSVLKRMKEGDDVLKGKFWNYCPVMHAPTCNGIFQAGYLNNFHIRFLLGSREGRKIPWGKVTEEHLEKAKRILEDFDLVIPIDFTADALPALQCAVGARYDVGIAGTPEGRYKWPTYRKRSDMNRARCISKEPPKSHHDRERLELCEHFNRHN